MTEINIYKYYPETRTGENIFVDRKSIDNLGIRTDGYGQVVSFGLDEKGYFGYFDLSYQKSRDIELNENLFEMLNSRVEFYYSKDEMDRRKIDKELREQSYRMSKEGIFRSHKNRLKRFLKNDIEEIMLRYEPGDIILEYVVKSATLDEHISNTNFERIVYKNESREFVENKMSMYLKDIDDYGELIGIDGDGQWIEIVSLSLQRKKS